jgi:Spy/CpxP family protein refolding chaperone
MKKIVMGFLALSLAFASVHAQSTENKSEKKHHHHGQGKIFKKLDLTQDQKTSMKQIREEFHKKMSDLKKQDGLSKEQLKESRKELKMQQREKMESILTAEQKSKLASIKAEWKAKHKDRDSKSANSKRFKELNLTADQQAKMKDLREGFRTKMETIRNDQALTQAQKKEKMKDLADKRKEEIKNILNPDQINRWESMKKEHKEKETK